MGNHDHDDDKTLDELFLEAFMKTVKNMNGGNAENEDKPETINDGNADSDITDMFDTIWHIAYILAHKAFELDDVKTANTLHYRAVDIMTTCMSMKRDLAEHDGADSKADL